jgi:tyrosyl-DNA phosphodiesterase-1
MERAQLEQERLTRLKRLCGELHPQSTEPPSKRQALSREMSSASALEAGPSRRERGREIVNEDAEVFWDGELRQTANAHVEVGHNGEDGRQVFRLSQIIGDVSFGFLPVFSPPSHILK